MGSLRDPQHIKVEFAKGEKPVRQVTLACDNYPVAECTAPRVLAALRETFDFLAEDALEYCEVAAPTCSHRRPVLVPATGPGVPSEAPPWTLRAVVVLKRLEDATALVDASKTVKFKRPTGEGDEQQEFGVIALYAREEPMDRPNLVRLNANGDESNPVAGTKHRRDDDGGGRGGKRMKAPPNPVLYVMFPFGKCATEEQLRAAMSVYGPVRYIRTLSGKSIAFVHFDDTQSAMDAKAALQRRPLFNDPKISIEFSKTNEADVGVPSEGGRNPLHSREHGHPPHGAHEPYRQAGRDGGPTRDWHGAPPPPYHQPPPPPAAGPYGAAPRHFNQPPPPHGYGGAPTPHMQPVYGAHQHPPPPPHPAGGHGRYAPPPAHVPPPAYPPERSAAVPPMHAPHMAPPPMPPQPMPPPQQQPLPPRQQLPPPPAATGIGLDPGTWTGDLMKSGERVCSVLIADIPPAARSVLTPTLASLDCTTRAPWSSIETLLQRWRTGDAGTPPAGPPTVLNVKAKDREGLAAYSQFAYSLMERAIAGVVRVAGAPSRMGQSAADVSRVIFVLPPASDVLSALGLPNTTDCLLAVLPPDGAAGLATATAGAVPPPAQLVGAPPEQNDQAQRLMNTLELASKLLSFPHQPNGGV